MGNPERLSKFRAEVTVVLNSRRTEVTRQPNGTGVWVRPCGFGSLNRRQHSQTGGLARGQIDGPAIDSVVGIEGNVVICPLAIRHFLRWSIVANGICSSQCLRERRRTFRGRSFRRFRRRGASRPLQANRAASKSKDELRGDLPDSWATLWLRQFHSKLR